MDSQIFSSSNYLRTKHTIPGKSDFVIEFLGTYANYFRVLNLGTSPLYFGTISTPSSALFDFKVNAGSLGHFCEPFERDRLYVYNPSTEPTDIILTRWKDEFDGSFASMNNLSIAIDGEVRTDGIVKGFESSLPSGSNNIGKVTVNETQITQLINEIQDVNEALSDKATKEKQTAIYNKLISINTSLDYISEHLTGEKAVKTVSKIVTPEEIFFYGNPNYMLYMGNNIKKIYIPIELINEVYKVDIERGEFTPTLKIVKNNNITALNLLEPINIKFLEMAKVNCDYAFIMFPYMDDENIVKAIVEIEDDYDIEEEEEEITIEGFEDSSLTIEKLSKYTDLKITEITEILFPGGNTKFRIEWDTTLGFTINEMITMGIPYKFNSENLRITNVQFDYGDILLPLTIIVKVRGTR